MVPDGVDPASLTFGPDGPLPSDFGAAYRQPLWLTDTSRYVDILTAQADTPGGPGMINTLPDFSFAAYAEEGAALIPAGLYTIGIACTVGPASSTQLDRYWTTSLEIVHDAVDVPGGFVWQVPVGSAPTSTTTTTTTSTTVATASTSTSTTTVAGGTTTTSPVADGSSTTTTVSGSGATTTSTTLEGGATTSSTTPALGGGTPTGGGGPLTPTVPPIPTPRLAATGSSSWTLVAWAVGLLVLGRIAILIGRTPKVIQSDKK